MMDGITMMRWLWSSSIAARSEWSGQSLGVGVTAYDPILSDSSAQSQQPGARLRTSVNFLRGSPCAHNLHSWQSPLGFPHREAGDLSVTFKVSSSSMSSLGKFLVGNIHDTASF